ncbi:MAG: hypothetical protein Q8K63_16005, partial [Acidimicrobiales bacterium]|nr:hypothetical protein [Acidimicrobiales bacterium]
SMLPTYLMAGGAGLIGVIVISRRRSAKHVAAVAVVLVVALGGVTGTPRKALAAESAAATIVAEDGKEQLTKGDKATPFTLQLPTGAACAGDSANDGYRVQSYHVPATVDASTLRFEETGPQPTGLGDAFRQPLYATNANPYVHAQTAPATPAPGPGTVINVPAFDFAQYKPDMVRAGAYKVGIACARPDGSIERLWETAIDLGADGSWTVASKTAVTGSSEGTAASGSRDSAATSSTAAAFAKSGAAASEDDAADAAVAEPTGAAPTMQVMVGGTVGSPDTVPAQLLLAGAVLVALRIGFLVRRSVT